MKVTKIEIIEKQPGERSIKGRIYVWPEGETLLDNLMNRHSRPSDLYRGVVLPAVAAKIGVAKIKASWSQKCGCSCGCSPGFVVHGGILDGRTVSVTVTA